MRNSFFLRLTLRLAASERGDTASQLTWSLALLVAISALGLVGAHFVSPQLFDHAGPPAWLK